MAETPQKISDATDKYEFIEKLGQGSFGEVWKARDTQTGEIIALKYLRLDRTSREHLDLFKREFEILSEIRHTHLAHVFDFGYSPKADQYFFTTEFYAGREFLEATAGKPYTYVEELLVQILSALDYVHSQGIAHFDIKSDNVLVSEKDGQPHVKILDFGVASKLKSLPQAVVGTPSYMAPELITKGGVIDHRADLYSLGILLLRALTGRLPFDIEDTDAVLQWHVRGALPEEIWEGVTIPRYAREVIEKLLAKKPAERFSNARVILHFINASTGRKYLKVERDLAGKIPREGPLVERDDILDVLRRRLNEAVSTDTAIPAGQICIIAGAQGIGKSRILEEMRHVIELKELPFFEIICDWQVPAWPKIEEWLGRPETISAEMSEEWQLRLRIDGMLERAKAQPYCLLIDDFHKADRTTKSIISALSSKVAQDKREGRPSPLFILAATEETTKEALPLQRLSAEGIAQYIGLVLGETERSESVGKLLHQYSGGLPLLMVEGLRFLAPHLYKDEPLENLLPPPQIGLLYREKIDGLRPDEHDLLDILALLFRPSSESEIAAILESNIGTITAIAESCIRNELITGNAVERPGGGFVYYVSSQALSLDIIRSLEPEHSRRLHRMIARGLSKIEGIPLNEIAYHTAKGGDAETAIAYYRDASMNYKEHREIAAATDCLIKAINLCRPGVAAWRDLLQEASRLLIVAGSYREAENYLSKLRDYSTISIEELRGMYAMKIRHLDEARSAYMRALKLVEHGQELDRILLENSLGNVELQAGNYKIAEEIFTRTAEDAQHLQQHEQKKVNNNSLGLALALQGDTTRALTFYEEQLRQVDQTRTAEIVSLESSMGYVLFTASRYDEAIPHLRRAVELSETTGALHALFSSMGNLISALLKEARYDESLPLLQKMSDFQQRLGSRRDMAYNLLREGSVYLTVGMEEATQACFGRGRKIAQDLKDFGLAAWFLLMDGYREREYGDVAKAEELFMLAEYEAREQGEKELSSWTHFSLAELAFDADNHEKSRQYLEKITDPPKDTEFRTRLALLRARLEAPTYSGSLDDLFKPLEEVCVKDKIPELLWEVYHAWGRAAMSHNANTEAIPLLLKGIRVIESIAATLPEEYRDRYMRQRSRSRLFADFKELTEPTKAEKAKPHAAAKVYSSRPGIEATTADGSTLKTGEQHRAEGTAYEGPVDDSLKGDKKAAAEGTLYTGPSSKTDDDEPTVKVDRHHAETKKS